MRLSLPLPLNRTSPRRADRVLNVAHRGASVAAPENTLAAVRKAVAHDGDLVEVDVQRSKDGVPVLVHDATLARTTDARRVFPRRAPWLVGDFTFEELRKLDAGSWKSPDFAGERIPSLTEAVDVLRRTRVGLLLELKAPSLYPGIVPEVAAALRSIPGYVDTALDANRLVVQSFEPDAMREYKAADPDVPVGLLGSPTGQALVDAATWADQVNPSCYSVDAAYVDRVHELGMECLVWTVNRVSTMRRMVRIGVDGVITNRPDVMARVVQERHPRLTGAMSRLD